MSSYTPTVTTQATPYISVADMNPPGYSSLQGSMGENGYGLDEFYQQALSLQQLNNVMQLVRYLSQGNIQSVDMVSPPDPNQIQPTLLTSFKAVNFVFDGRGAFWLTMNALEDMHLVFRVRQKAISSELPGPSNFKALEEAGFGDFFKDYTSQV